jgi:hypothetical protein
MNTFEYSEHHGAVSISRLLQNSGVSIDDQRRIPPALLDRLAEAAINRMQAQADTTKVHPDWMF